MAQINIVLQKLYVTAQVIILSVSVLGSTISMIVSTHDFYATQTERMCVERAWSALPHYLIPIGIENTPHYPVEEAERAIKACGNVWIYTSSGSIQSVNGGIKVAGDYAFNYTFRDAWLHDGKYENTFQWLAPIAFLLLALVALGLKIFRSWLIWLLRPEPKPAS